MNAKLFFVLTIVALVCMLPSGIEGWRRRRWNRIFKPLCRVVCTPVCTSKTGQAAICTAGCHNICRGKREAEMPKEVAKIPSDFGVYDENGDGFIETEEWMHYWNSGDDSKNVDKIFEIADHDGDGKLSPEEFPDLPFEFEDETEEVDIDDTVSSSESISLEE